MIKYIASSFEFHLNNIQFIEYIKREKVFLLFINVCFIFAYLSLVYFIDIEHYYSYFTADQLIYYLKALYLYKEGGTDTYIYINKPAVIYPGLAGYLRVPILFLTENFNLQIRLFQITNILVLSTIGIMFAYYISLFLSETISSRMAIILSYFSLFFSIQWQLQVTSPLSDNIFSLISLTFILYIYTKQRNEAGTEKRFKIIDFSISTVLLLSAIFIKLTGIFLLFFPLLFFITKKSMMEKYYSRNALCTFIGSLIVIVVVVFLSNYEVIVFANRWINRFNNTHFKDWLLNFTGLSLPSQIVPNYYYFYSKSMTVDYLNFNWGASLNDILLLFIGICISAVIFVGLWSLRNKMMPEILYFLSSAIVFIPITTSTTRYLIPYQAFIMIFFIYGFQIIHKNWLKNKINLTYFNNKIVIFCLCLMFVAAMALRLDSYVKRSGGESLAEFKHMQTDVKDVYKGVKDYLSELPKRKALIIAYDGKWQAITKHKYYYPDEKLEDYVNEYDIYVVFDNVARFSSFNDFKERENKMILNLTKNEKIKTIKVYENYRKYAWGSIYNLKSFSTRE